ncbi:MFS transporter [Luedemannella helvata]|uniref:MFS transporter n=1 Tax=Luedemannella helvata TaxID=349315 RepID=UPI0031DE06E9
MTLTSTQPRVVPAARAAGRHRSPWLAVAALSVGIYALVMAEFLPASLLSPIAADMGVSEGTAGQAVTATAITGIIAAPTVGILVPRLDRRYLLASLTLLAIVSNAIVAVAPSYPVLLAARLLLGVAIAGFWAMALAVVGHLVPAGRMGRATMSINLGMSLATVTAVPVGTYLGEVLGWRPVFWLAVVVAFVALSLQLLWLPPVAPSGATPLRTLIDTARTRTMQLGLLAVLLVAGGHFAAFTYVRPAAERVPAITAPQLALLLTVFGVATFGGNLVAGWLADRRLRLILLLSPLLIGVATIGVAVLSSSYALIALSVGLWGLAFGGIPSVVMTWVSRVEPDRLEPAGGLITGMFQVAIAVGAAAGGLLLDAFDIQVALLVAGVAAAAGGVVFASARKV